MAFIKQADLRTAALEQVLQESVHTTQDAKARGRTTIFLSHSHHDTTLALGLKNKLKEQNVDLYIDWEDTAMPDQTNRETANRIQQKIIDCDIFLFLATQNSLSSRWCPWEIGFADGKKLHDRLLIVPTADDRGNYYGNEYLQLYHRLLIPNGMVKYGVFSPGKDNGVMFEKYSSIVK